MLLRKGKVLDGGADLGRRRNIRTQLHEAAHFGAHPARATVQHITLVDQDTFNGQKSLINL